MILNNGTWSAELDVQRPCSEPVHKAHFRLALDGVFSELEIAKERTRIGKRAERLASEREERALKSAFQKVSVF